MPLSWSKAKNIRGNTSGHAVMENESNSSGYDTTPSIMFRKQQAHPAAFYFLLLWKVLLSDCYTVSLESRWQIWFQWKTIVNLSVLPSFLLAAVFFSTFYPILLCQPQYINHSLSFSDYMSVFPDTLTFSQLTYQTHYFSLLKLRFSLLQRYLPSSHSAVLSIHPYSSSSSAFNSSILLSTHFQ